MHKENLEKEVKPLLMGNTNLIVDIHSSKQTKDLEEEIIKLIDSYGAPEDVAYEIKEFLITSGNIYSIIDIISECV